jgi:hypothetical protein
MADCSHLDQVTVEAESSYEACEDCVREGTQWVHLRVCLTCEHVGCCDSSPMKHASKHARESSHPIVSSAEPGEAWSWCYVDEVMLDLEAGHEH